MHVPDRTLSFARLRSPRTAIAIAAYLVMAAFGTAGLVTTGWLAEDPSTRNMMLTAVFVIGGTLLFTAAGVLWARIVGRAEGKLRADLLTAALQQPLPALQEQSSGELLDRIDDDTNAISRTFRQTGSAVLRIASDAPMLWIVAGLTWWPAWFIFPALVAGVYFFTRPDLALIKDRKVAEEEAWTAHAAAFEEAISARDDIRTSLGQPFVVRRLAELSAKIHVKFKAVLRVEVAVIGKSGLLLNSLLGGVAVVGAALATGGGLSVAGLVTLFLVTARMVGITAELTNLMPQIQEGFGAITRIRQLLDVAPEPSDGLPVLPGQLSLELRDLNFEYAPRGAGSDPTMTEAMPGHAPMTEAMPGHARMTEAMPGHAPMTEAMPGHAPMTEAMPGHAPTTNESPTDDIDELLAGAGVAAPSATGDHLAASGNVVVQNEVEGKSARSRRKANEVKANAKVTVVIGNPPYDDRAEGRGSWVERGTAASGEEDSSRPILDDFRDPDTARHFHNLKNLYVYFWRWATWKVWESTPQLPDGDAGVVCFITTAGYLAGPGFTGMRRYLREWASEGWVINLTPEGQRPDIPTRIFPGVQQPLAIGLFVRETGTTTAQP
ncbi:MAG: ABC transporter transmembrane domain-containing protein, partial [Promicromonosporaceae bacterium]|nr:ABC transporter transmembrane domain-containing protein [Promicromonosporaceae bacterium]